MQFSIICSNRSNTTLSHVCNPKPEFPSGPLSFDEIHQLPCYYPQQANGADREFQNGWQPYPLSGQGLRTPHRGS